MKPSLCALGVISKKGTAPTSGPKKAKVIKALRFECAKNKELFVLAVLAELTKLLSALLQFGQMLN